MSDHPLRGLHEGPTLGRMTSTTITPIPTAPRKISRRAIALIAALVALTAGWLIYFSQFGECDFHSRYCAVDIAGTRSEIGAAWEGHPVLYVSTWPQGTTHTIVG